jgi:hypothetical protein
MWEKADLADAADISLLSISKWISKSNGPTPRMIDKVTRAINDRYTQLGILDTVFREDILDEALPESRHKLVDPRLEAMEAMSKRGMTRTAIGKEFGISRERVRQIMGNFKDVETRICAVCGDLFAPGSTITQWCSPKCNHLFRKYGGTKPAYETTRLNSITKRVAPPNKEGCWKWQGTINPTTGYGVVTWNGKQTGVHRLVWQLVFGDIPDKMFVCHSCDQQSCCNPRHLFLGTALDNARDRDAKGRGHNLTFLHQAQIKAIQAFYDSPADCQWLADAFGVHPKTVYKIGKGLVHTGKPRKHRTVNYKALGTAKLTMAQAYRIRALYSYGNHTYRSLALMYHVKHTTISNIVTAGTWKNL